MGEEVEERSVCNFTAKGEGRRVGGTTSQLLEWRAGRDGARGGRAGGEGKNTKHRTTANVNTY